MPPHYPRRTSESEDGEHTYDETKQLLPEDYELSRDEYQDLVEFLSQIEPNLSIENTYLIVGNYGNDLRRINSVISTLNKEPSTLATSFNDVINESENIKNIALKFGLIAELVDYVVILADPTENQSPLVELEFLTNSIYIDKTYVLRRKRDDDEPERGELEEQIFELLEEREQLLYWENEYDLLNRVQELPGVES
ncbi:hypothetical protein [Haloarcula sp. CGMCC 1.2071]|uniref:hypothetical protein n=1 Tax=Haloarcula sp. CGMCC 1.2071 TaxID=3111454 RepID=UPI00300EF4B0